VSLSRQGPGAARHPSHRKTDNFAEKPPHRVSSFRWSAATRHDRIIETPSPRQPDSPSGSAALDLVREDFIEHNPRNRTGRQALMDKFRDSPLLDAKGEIKRVVAQNDLVVIHYQLVAPGTEPHGVAVVDIWRLEDRLIVEHWDVLQPVPAASENGNGMF
jgi:predicted SnoaL-like aldol condensation-catalyzing enzyme